MKTNALKGSFVRGALLGGLLGVFSSSLSAQEKLPVENDLKIISYNIRHGEGLDGKTDYVRIARMFREQQADVVALQEVDSVTGRSHKKDVLREVANEALMYPVLQRRYHSTADLMALDFWPGNILYLWNALLCRGVKRPGFCCWQSLMIIISDVLICH